MSRKLLSVFFAVVLVAMLWVTITASLDRSVLTAAAEIWADPWGRATLFDAYFAFLTIYIWVFLRERKPAARLVWFVLFMALGNFAIAAYFLAALRQRHGLFPQSQQLES